MGKLLTSGVLDAGEGEDLTPEGPGAADQQGSVNVPPTAVPEGGRGGGLQGAQLPPAVAVLQAVAARRGPKEQVSYMRERLQGWFDFE